MSVISLLALNNNIIIKKNNKNNKFFIKKNNRNNKFFIKKNNKNNKFFIKKNNKNNRFFIKKSINKNNIFEFFLNTYYYSRKRKRQKKSLREKLRYVFDKTTNLKFFLSDFIFDKYISFNFF